MFLFICVDFVVIGSFKLNKSFTNQKINIVACKYIIIIIIFFFLILFNKQFPIKLQILKMTNEIEALTIHIIVKQPIKCNVSTNALLNDSRIKKSYERSFHIANFSCL